MAFKLVLAVSSVLLVQAAFGQYAGCGCNGFGGYNGLGGAGLAGAGLAGAGLAGAGYGYGAGCGAAGVASTGGGLPVSSASPIAPVGVSVVSENVYEGQLAAGGNLPFLGTVGVDGVVPTAGAGAISYGCGDGAVAIGSEGPIGTGILSGQSFAPSAGLINGGIAGFGGINGFGAGYGLGVNNGFGAGYGLGNGYGNGGINGYGIGNGNGCGC